MRYQRQIQTRAQGSCQSPFLYFQSEVFTAVVKRQVPEHPLSPWRLTLVRHGRLLETPTLGAPGLQSTRVLPSREETCSSPPGPQGWPGRLRPNRESWSSLLCGPFSKAGAGRMLLILSTGCIQIFTVQPFSGLFEEMCCFIFFYVPSSS